MRIIQGFDNKPTTIKLNVSRAQNRVCEVWIEQLGLPKVKQTLAYATLPELLDLKDEIQTAINEIVK